MRLGGDTTAPGGHADHILDTGQALFTPLHVAMEMVPQLTRIGANSGGE